MPSPLIDRYRENKIANNHAVQTGIPTIAPYDQLPSPNHQYQGQLRAMNMLNNYNPFGSGSCPNYDFKIPNGPYMGKLITFGFGNSEVLYNGTAYSGLTGEEKKIVWFWLPNFIRATLLNYDKNYNI
ncbi:MAG: hypothetical protein EBU90_31180 [Proteobacteria bacterium]|nr:hypothetical protein [Pseudomonadota bacterium]